MHKPILYLGDASLHTAAAYLAGIIHHAGWEFDYLASDQDLGDDKLAATGRRLFVFSDYPTARISQQQQTAIVDQVRQGAGLLMIGGWESYQGLAGHWRQTPIGEALAVVIQAHDDRVNCQQTTLIRQLCEHPIVNGLPWNERPPAIGGFNRFTPKDNAQTLLAVDQYSVRLDNHRHQFHKTAEDPLLVVGGLEKGRTAALATDVAPHWVGPMVDWGDHRICVQAPASEEVEVGENYVKFFQQLLNWTGRIES